MDQPKRPKLRDRIKLPSLKASRRHISKRARRIERVSVRHVRKFILDRLEKAREVRRHIAIWVLLVAYVIVATFLQGSWYQEGYKTTAATGGGTYVEAVKGPLDSLNPLFASSQAEQSASRLIFSSLMSYDTTGHLNYDLASNLSVDSTQKVYTIKMRHDAKWQDGQPVTANDVKFTIDLIDNPDVHSTLAGFTNIDVKVLDKYTIQFTLPTAYAPFAGYLTFAVLPEHILKNISLSNLHETSFSTAPIGSGPFSFRLIQDVDTAGTRRILYLVRNSNYYGGVAKLSRFQLDVFPDNDSILKAVSTAQVNAAVGLTKTESARVNTTRYNVYSMPVDTGVYALFNTNSEILSDANVRKALQIGTDMTAVRAVLGSGVIPLDIPFTTSQISGDIPVKPAYDKTAASTMLENDGWVLKNGVRKKGDQVLRLSFVVIKNADYQKVADALVTQWKALGVTVNLRVVDPSNPVDSVTQDVLQPRNYDVLMYSYSSAADPDPYAYWHSSQTTTAGSNYANYNNAIADEALSTARGNANADLRNAKYLTFARQWLSDAPALGLYQSTLQYVVNKNNSSLTPSDKLVSSLDRYASVTDWTVDSRSVWTTP